VRITAGKETIIRVMPSPRSHLIMPMRKADGDCDRKEKCNDNHGYDENRAELVHPFLLPDTP
jgi:hypothetical protein